MTTTPIGIVVLLALSMLISAIFTWQRHRLHQTAGVAGIWQTFEDYVAQVLMIVMVTAAIMQVSVRYLLSGFIVVSWTEELALLALIWLSFWSGAAVTRKQDHIDFSVAFSFMSPSMKRVVLIFGDMLMIGMLAAIAWFGFIDARWLDIIMTVSLGLPVSSYAYAVPFILIIFVVHGIVNLLGHLKGPLDEGHHELEKETVL